MLMLNKAAIVTGGGTGVGRATSLPLGRVCQPEDIADGIVSLITGSRLVTGQTLTVDAGMMISGFQVKFD